MDPTELLTRDALKAAPALLGCKLMSRLGGQVTGGLIIEAEAYHGAQDPASHAYRGLTPRTAPMFEAAGTIYVYLSYGLHYCMNLVTGPAGEAQAVLLRALWPTDGAAIMQARRGGAPLERLANGPANLTQSLGVTRLQSGTRLGPELWLEPGVPVDAPHIMAGPRVGVSRGRELPWRFRIAPGGLANTIAKPNL